jgi:hypothetical protein
MSSVSDSATCVQLQQEKDPKYWGVDTGSIHDAIKDCGITFIRTEVLPLLKACGVHATYPAA